MASVARPRSSAALARASVDWMLPVTMSAEEYTGYTGEGSAPRCMECVETAHNWRGPREGSDPDSSRHRDLTLETPGQTEGFAEGNLEEGSDPCTPRHRDLTPMRCSARSSSAGSRFGRRRCTARRDRRSSD